MREGLLDAKRWRNLVKNDDVSTPDADDDGDDDRDGGGSDAEQTNLRY